MKKLISILILVCICMSLLAACNNSQPPNNPNNPGNTNTTTEPTQETTGDVTQNTTQGGSSSGNGPDFEINFDDLLPKN